MKTQWSLKDVDWQLYAKEMRARFADDEYADPMSELVSLKQTTSVEDYYDEFESLLNLLHLSDEYALSIFLSNLKPNLSKSIRFFNPKDLTHALNLTKQMESLVYNLPRKPFQSYNNSSPASTTTYPNQQLPKPNFQMNINNRPVLLPTPKFPALPYQNQSKPSTYNTNKTPALKFDVTKGSKVPTKEGKMLGEEKCCVFGVVLSMSMVTNVLSHSYINYW